MEEELSSIWTEIAAPTDQSAGAAWGCFDTNLPGASETAIGTGNQNTTDIENGCITSGTAADICANLTLGGFDDWFLPSKDELYLMYSNIGQGSSLVNVGGFSNDYYWSSTEVGDDDETTVGLASSTDAWGQGFGSGTQPNFGKFYTLYVRSVRAF
jgi:hypothetical protein